MVDSPWIYIPGPYSRYRINARGEVLSYCQCAEGKILKPTLNEKGYPCVMLYGDDGIKKRFRIHNLVALVFHGPRPEGLVARHRNGDQLDNTPGNLLYGTYSQNNFDQVNHGKHPESSRTHCDNGHEFTPANTMRRKTRKGTIVRKCKECHRLAIAGYRARKKAGLTPVHD